jgi:glutamine amidotransferase
MQLLFDRSLEDDTECLGLISGTATVLDAAPLPHIGWNSVRNETPSILAGLEPDPLFYFVHSYAVRPTDAGIVVGMTTHGTDAFASAVTSGPVTGLQFHPERSGGTGLSVLRSFLADERQVRHVA